VREKRIIRRKISAYLSSWLVCTLFLANLPFSIIHADSIEPTTINESHEIHQDPLASFSETTGYQEVQESTNVDKIAESTKTTEKTESMATLETEASSETESAAEQIANGRIMGTVWLDENEDGLHNKTEQPLAAIELQLMDGQDKSRLIKKTVTDSAGTYKFTDLEAGQYYVAISEQKLMEDSYTASKSSTDNKFSKDPKQQLSYTERLTIEESNVLAGVDAGLIGVSSREIPSIYEVYDSENALLVIESSLKAAVDYCNSAAGSTFTITVKADDPEQGLEAEIKQEKDITLTSAANSAAIRTITQNIEESVDSSGNEQNKRHIVVENGAKLTLRNIILAGEGKVYNADQWSPANGGVKVKGGTLLVGEGAMITKTFGNKGGAIEAETNSQIYLRSTGAILRNQSSDTAGGIYAQGSSVELSDTSCVSENVGQWRVGGIYLNNSSLRIEDDAKLSTNVAKHGEAGGIKAENNSSITMINGAIEDNTVEKSETEGSWNAGSFGGGIYMNGGKLTLQDTRVHQNTASDAGGGIYADNTELMLTRVEINSNETKLGDGGGIHQSGSSLTLNETKFSGNRATGNGGGLYANNSSVEITDSDFGSQTEAVKANQAHNGGGIFVKENQLTITNGKIDGNNAVADGGGIRVSGGAILKIRKTGDHNTSFTKNTAAYGGGISANEDSKITLEDVTIHNNTASQRGGGVNLDGVDTRLTMVNGTVSENEGLQCGGILVDKAIVEIENVKVIGNHATGNQAGSGYGGGILIETQSNGQGGWLAGKLTVTNSEFSNNLAFDGGAIYSSKYSQKLTITDSVFHGNQVRHHGGALFIDATITELFGTKILSNYANRYGGGLKIGDHSELMMTGTAVINSSTSVIEGNIARYGGGLSANDGSKIALKDTFVLNNKAKYIGEGDAELVENSHAIVDETEASNKGGDGGGINLDLPETKFTMENGKINGNHADASGGGLFATAEAEFVLGSVSSEVLIADNTADLQGGGLFLKQDVKGTITNSLVENNSTEVNGGGVRLEKNANFTIQNSQINRNTAAYGGGVSANTASTVDMNGTESEISENVAANLGGGVNIDNANTVFTLNEGSLAQNSARNGGGVFASDYAQCLMTGGFITQNSAINNGAGAYLQSSAMILITDGKISKNTAQRSGGGIFTEDYYYQSPVDATNFYKNITVTSPGEVTEDNRSQWKQKLPEVTGELKFDKTYLNDYQVNYFPDSVKIVYDPNGGGGLPYEERYLDGETAEIATIRSEKDLNFTPPSENYVFLYWSESSDGTGTRYSTEGTDSITMDSDKYLYAIWGPPTTLSGTVFLDSNRNSIYDSNEILENRTVTLYKKENDGYEKVESTVTNQDGKYYFAVTDKGTYKISVKVTDGEYGKYGFVKKGTTDFSSHINQDGYSDPLLIDIGNELKPILNAGYVESVVETGIKLNETNWFFYLILLLLVSLVLKRFSLMRKWVN
jgi:predicted outer membrane repeat protein